MSRGLSLFKMLFVVTVVGVVILGRQAGAVEVNFTATIKSGSAALLIASRSQLGFSQDRVGSGLILTFDKSIQGSLQAVKPQLRTYVDDMRIEDQGETLVIMLAAGSQASIRRSGNDIVIDLSAAGRPPAKIADSADGLPAVAVRIGRHPTYNRVVFDWPKAVKFSFDVDNDQARLSFARGARFDRQGLRRKLPAEVKLLDVAADKSDREFVFALPAELQPKAFTAGTKVVVDFPTAAAAVTAKPVSPVVKTKAKPKIKTVAAAPKATVKKTKQPAVVAETTPNPPPETKPAAAGATTASSAAPPTTASAVQVAPRPQAAAKETQTISMTAVDSSQPKPAVGKVVKPSPAVGNSNTPTTDPSRAAKNSMFNVLPERLISGPSLPVTSQINDGLLSIRFEWSELVPAAVFVRAGYLWVVFDQSVRFDFSKFAVEDNLRIGRVEQIPGVAGSALRVELVPGVDPRVWRDGLAWVVELQPQEILPQVPLTITTQMVALNGPRLFVPIDSVGKTVMLIDPMVGDNLLVVPLSQLGRGVDKARKYAQLTVLRSAQGIAISPNIDGIQIASLPDGMTIGSADGLKLSPPPDNKGQELAPSLDGLPPGLAPGRIFAMQRWQRGGEDNFMDNKQELQGLVADATSVARNAPRLALAQFYFAHGLAAETKGLLTIIGEDDQQLVSRMDVRAMRGAAALMLGRVKPALVDLEHPSLDGYSEAELWRGAANAAAGLWPEAAENFIRGGEIPGDYPRSFAADLAMLAAETLIRSGDYEAASTFLDVVSGRQPSDAESARLRYLRAQVLFAAGDEQSAVSLWRAGADGNDRWSQVRSERDLVKYELAEGIISTIDAIDRLEALRFTWRGDEVEFGLLEELGELYLTEADYVRGLVALKQAVTNFPENSSTPALTERMTEAFQKIFTDGSAAAMTPLNALSLYDRFRELTPVGAAGDQIIESLVDRLVEVDLLDRAALLLERQVQFRLQGPDKARVGARLALIHLLDRQAAAAIKALDGSVSPGLSLDLARERNRLRSRSIFELGDPENALSLIRRDSSKDADLLRADIMWQTQKWGPVTPVFERLIGDRGTDGRRIDERTAVLVLNWTIAAFMSKDGRAVNLARERFSKAMEETPYREAFLLLTGDNRDNPADILSLTKRYDEIGRVQSFLTSYRDKLKVGPLSAATN